MLGIELHWWVIVLLVVLSVSLLLLVAAWLLWRRLDQRSRRLMDRLRRLPLRSKFGLAKALLRDPRVPLPVRALPVILVLYLALPLDLVPDFIPVLGQVDDIAVAIVSVVLLLGLTPRDVLEEHIAAAEAGA